MRMTFNVTMEIHEPGCVYILLLMFLHMTQVYTCRNTCKSCTTDNSCAECNPNYYGEDCENNCHCYDGGCNRITGECDACPNCVSCSSLSQCTNCVAGYYNYNGACTVCPTNCLSCTGSNNCWTCKAGYYIYHGACKVCPTNCLSCTGSNNCWTCKAGYYIYHGECKVCPTNCLSCMGSNNCWTCKAGYYNYYGACTVCATNCLSCTWWTNCRTCKAGYYNTNSDNTCSSECQPGFYGYDCSKSCSSNCVNLICDKSDGTCNTCPKMCTSCTSDTLCSSCVNGYYGVTCQNECPANCNANTCNMNGHCIYCNDGFKGNYCNQSCSDKCAKCDISGSCLMCERGYFGPSCETACPVTCSACQSSTYCSSCVDGYYGAACKIKCPDQCKQGAQCEKKNGYCKQCPDGKTGRQCSSDCATSCTICYINRSNNCTACKDGKYGSYFPSHYHCLYSCPDNCLSRKCKVDTGYCYNCTVGFYGNKCDCPINCKCEYASSYLCSGCKDGFMNINNNCECRQDKCTDSSCDTSCKNKTWYLDTLSRSCCKCSKNCKNRECNSSNECTLGCVDGFYGKNCAETCSSQDRNCLKCLAQNEYFTRSSCLECTIGNFPSNHTNRCTHCNATCLKKKCSTTTGLCTDGCEVGFWGDFCQNACNHTCSKCNRYNGSCEICSDGRYSLDCSLLCNDGCNQSNGQTLCKITDGTCLYGCLSSKNHGKTCTLNCSENCLDQNCEWETGHCRNGCINNRYGEKCDQMCSDHCLSLNNKLSLCHHRNGSCLSGCTPGYYGDKCEEMCSTNCKNTTCKQSSGECLFGCNDGFTESTCVQVLAATGSDSIDGAVIWGAVGGVVFIVLVAALVIVVLCVIQKRRNRKPRLESKLQYDNSSDLNQNNARLNDPVPIYNNTSESVNLYSSVVETDESTTAVISNPNYQPPPERLRMSTHSVISYVEVEEEDEPDNVPTPIPYAAADKTYYNVVRRVHVDKLAEYVTKKQSEDYEEEFLEFKHGLVEGISYADSRKRANVGKNRYRSIYPYDEHRVRLTGKGTDYINASYLDGYHKQNEYIACLGPMEKNTDKFVNFWRMVWQTKVEKVVMVTNLYENGSNKCDQYWPNTGKSVIYGDVTVTCHSEDVYADYTVRSFSVSSMSENRKLNHIHYTAWPDKGVPDDVTSLIEFRQKVISTTTSLDGPTIVHCSAGVGRTGTYIALDILTTEGEQQRTVDIFGCVEHMREHRVNMVQMAEQYEYLHNALVHTLTFDSHAIPADTFQAYYTSISDSEMTKKFEQIQNSKEEKTKDEIKAINRNKTMTKSNRPHSDIPGDLHRPKLSLLKTSGSSDYINAVYINSFKTKNRFIVAQTPLPGTALDFVSLIFQTNCSCIVSMEPVERLKDMTVGTYFPADNQELNIGQFKITSAKGETRPQCILRKLTIVKQGQSGNNKRTIHHYQYMQWQSGKLVPDNAAALLQMVRDVDKKAHESSEAGPIIIHCLNGGEKSGLFCVVTMLIEKMEIEHEVSVVNCVRMVKSRRESAIPNKDQFSFCYQCVNAYLQSFDIYSNFSLRI